jgi:hypothetical protein
MPCRQGTGSGRQPVNLPRQGLGLAQRPSAALAASLAPTRASARTPMAASSVHRAALRDRLGRRVCQRFKRSKLRQRRLGHRGSVGLWSFITTPRGTWSARAAFTLKFCRFIARAQRGGKGLRPHH